MRLEEEEEENNLQDGFKLFLRRFWLARWPHLKEGKEDFLSRSDPAPGPVDLQGGLQYYNYDPELQIVLRIPWIPDNSGWKEGNFGAMRSFQGTISQWICSLILSAILARQVESASRGRVVLQVNIKPQITQFLRRCSSISVGPKCKI